MFHSAETAELKKGHAKAPQYNMLSIPFLKAFSTMFWLENVIGPGNERKASSCRSSSVLSFSTSNHPGFSVLSSFFHGISLHRSRI